MDKGPRAMLSMRLFNGFRMLAEKTSEPEELKILVETLAFKSPARSQIPVGDYQDA